MYYSIIIIFHTLTIVQINLPEEKRLLTRYESRECIRCMAVWCNSKRNNIKCDMTVRHCKHYRVCDIKTWLKEQNASCDQN